MFRKILRRLALGFGLLLVLGAAFYLLAVLISQPMPPAPVIEQFRGQGIIVLAHQGGDGERPSNTLVAFSHAVELGAHMLEMDVHTTADGEIVIIHDDTVDRTTDGTGRVNDLTLADIQALDAAYDWPTLSEHPDTGRGIHPYRGQGITIPALREVLEAFPDKPMMIEIKQETPPMGQALCDMLREYERTDNTIVASFSTVAMDDFRAVCPEVATSGVQQEVTAYFALNMVGLSAAWQPTTHSFSVPQSFSGLEVLTESFVANTRQHNVVVYPWTINSEEEMRRMIALGVDGFITDYPTLALELVRGTSPRF